MQISDVVLCFFLGLIGYFFGATFGYCLDRLLQRFDTPTPAQVIREAVEFISFDAMPEPSSYTYIRQSYALAIIQKALLCRYISGEQANQLTDDVLGVDEDAHHAA